MRDRFYYDGPLTDRVALDASEAHHLGRVLRKRSGDEVELFDGRGASAIASVADVNRRSVALDIHSTIDPPQSSRPEVILAVAPPKRDRFRWLVEKTTEIGVDRLIPLQSARSVVDPRETKLAKLRQTVIAACKQSGRNRLLEITDATPLDRMIATEATAETLLLVGCHAGVSVTALLEHAVPPPSRIVIVIGPEGGLTELEREQLRAQGAVFIKVSPQVLRIETAAVAVSACLVAQLTG